MVHVLAVNKNCIFLGFFNFLREKFSVSCDIFVLENRAWYFSMLIIYSF